jgi:hypothetical protein
MSRRAIGFVGAVGVVFGVAVGGTARAAEAAVKASVPATAVGQPAPVSVVFSVPEGSHISPDAPLTLKFKGPEAVHFAKTTLHYADAQKGGAGAPTFSNDATPSAAGTHDLVINASYYVCTAELCNRQTKTLHVALTAK